MSYLFCSHNPNTSNSLSLSARKNNCKAVKRFLKKINPNCVDNRGWTCLHEAAASDSYESLVIILKDRRCRPLAETHEGHTALYLACRQKCSIKIIKALLKTEDIVNYGSTENVTPLHIASGQGRVELMQLLLDYGAMLDVQDFDDETPLHDAVLNSESLAVNLLLHAGANPDIKNKNYKTPFHIACSRGNYKIVKYMMPFIVDINEQDDSGSTPLRLSISGLNDKVVAFLLENGADPHIADSDKRTPLDAALDAGNLSIFQILLDATDRDKISRNIIYMACKAHTFNFRILEALLYYDLGPDYFDFMVPFNVCLEKIGDIQPSYLTSAPLNSYLNVSEYIYKQSPEKFKEFFYLFLMGGASVNAKNDMECPPIVYLHYTTHKLYFPEAFKILTENNCNVDSCSTVGQRANVIMPDVFVASLSSDPTTLTYVLRHSLYCDPGLLLRFALEDRIILNRISVKVQQNILRMINEQWEGKLANDFLYLVPTLTDICRLKIRQSLKTGILLKTTKQFFNAIQILPIPKPLKDYLHYT
ncbi:hypothetical protein ACJJTC_006284 [Scirpophaga incertulas]